MTVSHAGFQQLQAGLLAAAIGMLLVAIYAFFYYRLLGTVIFLSLILSGLLTFGALVFLGRTAASRSASLAIAGFIVSLGVAADSFVIYSSGSRTRSTRVVVRAAPFPGPGRGPDVRSSRPTPSPSWRPWCCTSCRSVR